METLNTIEKITLLVSVSVVALINLSIVVHKVKMKEATKRFAKINLVTILCMSSFLMKSQDTIYLKDKTVVPAKIIEVGISEIKYQRLDNLTGPNYLANKSDIFLIKYSNGAMDTIKSVATTVEQTTINIGYKEKPDRVRLSRSRMVYHNETISDRQLKSMIAELPSSETQIKLKIEFKKLNEYKLKESVLSPALFVSGAAIHFMALGSAFGANGGAGVSNGTALASTFIAGAILRISGHVLNIVYRNKKKSKREDIVNIYNGDFN